jgi:hypothetical protein
VATGNVGKLIKQVGIAHNQGSHSQQRWFCIDNARLVVP